MTKKKLTEELIKAFDQLMPKKPVYPRMAVQDEEMLENSSTDSEDSDGEDVEPNKRVTVNVQIIDVPSMDFQRVWKTARCKLPSKYLADNIQKELETALQKLANLRTKPVNPIEWLGYCLLNIHHEKTREVSVDHYPKPTMAQRRYQTLAISLNAKIAPVPVTVPVRRPVRYHDIHMSMCYGDNISDEVTFPLHALKRKHPEPLQ